MKKLYKLFPIAIAVLIMACGNSSSEDQSNDAATTDSVAKAATIELVKLWETDTLLITAEAVAYNATLNQCFVSNIGAVPPDAKDGDGSISKIDIEGKIVEKDWVTGLNAPKGLAFDDEFLYVTDITELLKIKIETGEIVHKYAIDTAKFLNDAAISGDEVYFTDSGSGAVYLLKNDEVTLFSRLEGKSSNGVFIEEKRVLVVTFDTGDFYAIDKETKEQTLLTSGFAGGDGIVAIEQGYIVSNWNGEVNFVAKEAGSKPVKILDTKEQGINAADIYLVPEKNILLVPTFFGNSVAAYQINVK